MLADVGAVYRSRRRSGCARDLGVGANVFGGISEMGNPFTQNGAATPVRSACSRCASGVAADYMVTPNVLTTVTPVAFTYSPAKDGLRSDIKSLTRLDFMLGVGYRM